MPKNEIRSHVDISLKVAAPAGDFGFVEPAVLYLLALLASLMMIYEIHHISRTNHILACLHYYLFFRLTS